MTMKKTYVLDTNVLIQAPYALECFEDNRIVLPLAVLEELDSLKSAEGEAGRNARQTIRYLESLRLQGNLLEGVTLQNGGSLRLEVNCVEVQLPKGFPDHKNDNRILKVCLGIREKERPVILVTKDIVVRLKAQMLGIEAEDFTTEQVPVTEEQYTGRCEAYVSEKKFENFKKKPISPDDLYQVNETGERLPVELVPNQFVILKADQSVKKTQLGRFDGKHVLRVPVSDGHMGAVFVRFARKPSQEEILQAWKDFRGPAQELELPSAPKQFLHYFEEADRPQPKLDRMLENGMAVSIGRLRPDTQYDYKFVCLSHNTLRGAAGGGVLLAELLAAKGYFD